MSGNESDKKITQFLQLMDPADSGSLDKLYVLVYDHLRQLAARQLARERANHTFTASDLVSEGFFKLRNIQNIEWSSRSHFYKVSVRAMKQVLIDHARTKNRDKRGGGETDLPLEEAFELSDSSQRTIEDLLSLYDALDAYGKYDKQGRGKEILELVYFHGLTHKEIAETLGVTTKTVQRDLRVAEAWLKRYFGVKSDKTRLSAR